MMKNMKISAKLTAGFAVVAGLALIVGIVCLLCIYSMSGTNTQMYENHVRPLESVRTADLAISDAQTQYCSVIIYSLYNDREMAQSAKGKVETHLADFRASLEQISGWAETNEEKLLVSELQNIYTSQYLPSVKETIAAAIEDVSIHSQTDKIKRLMAENTSIGQRLHGVINELSALKSRDAKTAQANAQSMADGIFVFVILAMLVTCAAVILIVRYLSNRIGTPIKILSDFFVRFGTAGDLSKTEADEKNIAENGENKDEIGMCINAAAVMGQRLTEISEKMSQITKGDLTVTIQALSEKDGIGTAVNKMVESLNMMFGRINVSAAQVSVASKQIADGAQILAQGSTEQASAIEQLSTSISAVTGKTKQNTGISREAADLSESIKENAEKGSMQMDQMMQAVREINEASNQIGKVIKVIDDIAFQTNILALNAAVEAARAGQHGKGFAVVAEEVRNLAAKSAEAARDTGGLIENSIEKANLGLAIATETAASLQEIVEGINRSAEIVMQIAQSSDEQASAIGQINTGIDQVAQVVQQNSATAEESAAASEEMSGQSELLSQLISQFKLNNTDVHPQKKSLPSITKIQGNPYAMPEETPFTLGAVSGDFGKY